ncbi:hypothetical protein BDW60DRAFT_190731, partial [Aspergillus nidulans var. acristatus]
MRVLCCVVLLVFARVYLRCTPYRYLIYINFLCLISCASSQSCLSILRKSGHVTSLVKPLICDIYLSPTLWRSVHRRDEVLFRIRVDYFL